MKKTLKITLDTVITIDFSDWGLSDAQQNGGIESKRLIINHYLDQSGVDEFEISAKNIGSLFEAMAEVVKFENEAFLMPKNELEYTI